MVWNPSPKVAAARDIGKKFSKAQVIVLMIDQDDGTLEVASYGKTRELCADAKKIGDVAFDAVMAHLSSNAVLTGAAQEPTGNGAPSHRVRLKT